MKNSNDSSWEFLLFFYSQLFFIVLFVYMYSVDITEHVALLLV